MMVSFQSLVFDPAGHVVLNASRDRSDFLTRGRRVSKTATLDGGSFIFDGGLSDSDRVLNFVVQTISDEALEVLLHLNRNYTMVLCSVWNELFSGVLEQVNIRTDIKIQFLVKEKLA